MMTSQWLTCPMRLLAMQELGCFHLPGILCRSMNMGPCIIMLQHEAMLMDEWHKNLAERSHRGISVDSKFHHYETPVSVVHNIPHRHHGPLDSTTLRSANLSATVCHLPCPEKSQIHPWREHLSKVPDAVEFEHLITKVSNDDGQVETLMRTTSMQMSFPEMFSDGLFRNCCSSCLGGWTQMVLEAKMLDVEAVGWCGYMWSAVGCTAKFSETLSEDGPAVVPVGCSYKNLHHQWLCSVINCTFYCVL